MEHNVIDAIVADHVYVYTALAKRGNQTKYVRTVLPAGQERDLHCGPISLAALGFDQSRFSSCYSRHSGTRLRPETS